MTYREYVQKNYPHFVSNEYIGGVRSCPYDYISYPSFTSDEFCICQLEGKGRAQDFYCKKCFDKEIRLDAFDKLTGAPVYPAEP